jgi:cytochrome c553
MQNSSTQHRITQHRITQHRIPVLVAVVVLAGFGVAHAKPSISDGSRLFAPCVVCHQPNAGGSANGVIPNLAGQQKGYLEKQLTLFRSGACADSALRVAAVHSTFSDPRNIVVMAGYLSGLDANPGTVTGPGDHLRVGQELYEHICAACHGDGGRGQRGNRVPRIGGQHYPYLRRQMEQASGFHKELAPPEMTGALRGMSPQEEDALADYISRLGRTDAPVEVNRLDAAATSQAPR